MDRTFEEIRSEVFHLDYDSQRRLASEIEENLTDIKSEYNEEWTAELHRRVEQHRRGEGTYVTWEHMMDMAEKMISKAERCREDLLWSEKHSLETFYWVSC
jgi:putative addiction module component (TIGR02574 family)